MPPVFPGDKADTLEELADMLGLDRGALLKTVQEYNAACQVGTFDHTIMDDCHTNGLEPAKTHWALPIDTGPFYGYILRPGVTFTYLGLKTTDRAEVHFGGKPSDNLAEITKLHRAFRKYLKPDGWMDSWCRDYLRDMRRRGQ